MTQYKKYNFKTFLYLIGGALMLVTAFSFFNKNKVDYNADIKPIFNKKCIACHGGVKQNGGFSLLFEEDAKAKLKSGAYAIVPYKPSKSAIINRIKSNDPEERMPYKHDPLLAKEIDLLTQWIKQGAPWGTHWSYEKVKAPEIPVARDQWIKNNIDAYILPPLKSIGLAPRAQADAATLARRLSLDLIGYNNIDSIQDRFIKNPTDKNYEELIDTLLVSPHYGEKWTSMWLDLARYADTKGYEKDGGRTIWKYKNWLIDAFNKDMPYDQFITEQLAGDLLPNPTEANYIATAFHRNTMTNDEGGTDNEEYRTAAVIDRTNTTWETIMGTTFACVQCHSHPYDPIRHKEYYQVLSYFNNTRDFDTEEEYPWYRHLDTRYQPKLDSLQDYLQKNTSPEQVQSIINFIKTYQPARYSSEADSLVSSALVDTKWLAMRDASSARLPACALELNTKLMISYRQISKSGTISFKLDNPNGKEIGKIQWKNAQPNWSKIEIDIDPIPGIQDLYITFDSKDLKNTLKYGAMFDWFHFSKGFPDSDGKMATKAKNDYWELVNAKVSHTPIMYENPSGYRRVNQMFERGNWLVKTDTVQEGIPAIFGKITDETQNRLSFAKWIVSPDHPLTARVIVNRLWEQIWGTGLVETLEDFGSQGTHPSNHALLDYMAYRLVHHHKWSIKSMLKEIVLSATYRQDSKITSTAAEKDFFNRYHGRGPRLRLSAEQLRDQILGASAFIDSIYTGPPLMPYQPPGVWLSPYSSSKWVNSTGKNKYKRSVYTYWKRTSAYPSMTNFDATEREVCLSRRIRTNTPLQALTLLNDSSYIDLASKLSERYFDANTDYLQPEKTIDNIYRSILNKAISNEKLQVLKSLYYNTYIHHARATNSLIQAQKQAFSMVTIAIFNLDEVVTKS